MSDVPLPIAAPPRAGDIPRIALDASKARDLWQWQATVSLADGMARTVAAFRAEAGV